MPQEDDLLRCETCLRGTYEVPIIEKPKRVAYLSDVQNIDQNTGDHREQENICLDCLKNEIENLSAQCKDRTTIRFTTKIVTTPRRLMQENLWDKACEVLGINPWSINEGLLNQDEPLEVPEDKAHIIGII